jgi:hypothetical protein
VDKSQLDVLFHETANRVNFVFIAFFLAEMMMKLNQICKYFDQPMSNASTRVSRTCYNSICRVPLLSSSCTLGQCLQISGYRSYRNFLRYHNALMLKNANSSAHDSKTSNYTPTSDIIASIQEPVKSPEFVARVNAATEMVQNHLHFHEVKFFDFLNDLCDHFKLKTEIRVAGGWVRDKLLGLSSKDIDLTLSDFTAKQFLIFVEEYAKMKNIPCSFCIVSANVEQSKHLETITGTILGLNVDFVNLRSEKYASNSTNRIPIQMAIGTPLEDAFRRDFTINSLFYNVRSRQVEDFTGRGILDMDRGVLRTPINADLIFEDDPLRVSANFSTFYLFIVFLI